MYTMSTLLEQLQNDVTSCDVEMRRHAARQLFTTDKQWLTTASFGSYQHLLKALLLRIPVLIYVHERADGVTFDVLKGGEVIEALRALEKPESGPDMALYRRIMDTELQVVVFRSSMSDADVKTCMQLMHL